MTVDNSQNSTAVLYICSEFVVTNEKTRTRHFTNNPCIKSYLLRYYIVYPVHRWPRFTFSRKIERLGTWKVFGHQLAASWWDEELRRPFNGALVTHILQEFSTSWTSSERERETFRPDRKLRHGVCLKRYLVDVRQWITSDAKHARRDCI